MISARFIVSAPVVIVIVAGVGFAKGLNSLGREELRVVAEGLAAVDVDGLLVGILRPELLVLKLGCE